MRQQQIFNRTTEKELNQQVAMTQSPDLNLTEGLWQDPEQAVNEQMSENLKELNKIVKKRRSKYFSNYRQIKQKTITKSYT